MAARSTPQTYCDGRIKFELDAGHHEIQLDYGTDWRTVSAEPSA